ncbi:hypothetical protein NESM_000815100 [Novymonas esmeraldas]|uniref:Uncharacterized protein n=1 Tax=Novymonas esmeraldas TaxID=1808958 RepID=A0AAW0EXL4_9TRYP
MARALVFLLGLVLLAAGAAALELHLPAEIYDNAAGDWSVEVISSCRPSLLGTVTLLNTTAVVEWQDDGAPEMRISGQSAKSSLSAAALAHFVATESLEVSYALCEREENYLATPQRPAQVSGMATTYLTAYSGVLRTAADGGACDGTGERNVAIHAMGAPLAPSHTKEWRVQEALHVIEIVIDTRGMEGTCANAQAGEGPIDATATENKKRSRKRRAQRFLSSGAVVSAADEMIVDNGIVALRLIRRSSTHQPWFLRYYSPLMFATIFIVYRIVHSFFSARAAK